MIFGLTVKIGLTVRPNGKQNLAFRFSIIRPSRFGLTAPPPIYSVLWIQSTGPTELL